MKSFFKLVCFCFLVLSVASASLVAAPAKSVVSTAASGTKIGFVDVEKIFDPAGKLFYKGVNDIEEKIQKDFEKFYKNSGAEEKGAKLRKLQDEINDAEDILSKKALEEKKKEFAKKSEELKSLQMELINKQQSIQRRMQIEILEKVKKATRDVAQREGFGIIVSVGTLYCKDALDITEKVAKKMNNDFEAEQKKKEEAAKKK